jgi:hypothetical protein
MTELHQTAAESHQEQHWADLDAAEVELCTTFGNPKFGWPASVGSLSEGALLIESRRMSCELDRVEQATLNASPVKTGDREFEEALEVALGLPWNRLLRLELCSLDSQRGQWRRRQGGRMEDLTGFARFEFTGASHGIGHRLGDGGIPQESFLTFTAGLEGRSLRPEELGGDRKTG